jgi:heme exporter protein D
MDLGPHGFFIAAAYAATALIVAGLVLRAAIDHRAQQRALAELEARGARRRSELDRAAPEPRGAGAALDLGRSSGLVSNGGGA